MEMKFYVVFAQLLKTLRIDRRLLPIGKGDILAGTRVLFITGNLHHWTATKSFGGYAAIHLILSMMRINSSIGILNAVSGYHNFARMPAFHGMPVWYGPPLNGYSSNVDIHCSAGIEEVVSEFKPDILHIFSFEQWDTAIIAIAKRMNIKIVVTPLDYHILCARTTLVRADGRLCTGVTTFEECRDCLLGGRTGLYTFIKQVAYRIPASALIPSRIAAESKATKSRVLTAARRIEAWAQYVESVDHWIAPSKAMKSILCTNGVPEGHVTHIPYGYDGPAGSRSPIRRRDSKIIFGFAGRPLYEKGVHLLAEGFLAARKRTGKAKLAIFGSSPTEKNSHGRKALMRLSRGAGKDVTFSSYDGTDRVAVAAAQDSIDVMVVPSLWYDNLPLVVVESLAHGTPVIASSHSSAADPIEDGRNGLLFDAFTQGDLADKMIKFILGAHMQQIQYGRTSAQEAMEVQRVYGLV